ncbi:MAG: hypothetical protein Q9214_001835, partial [Letrouitia sp. 1 TL-2023]
MYAHLLQPLQASNLTAASLENLVAGPLDQHLEGLYAALSALLRLLMSRSTRSKRLGGLMFLMSRSCPISQMVWRFQPVQDTMLPMTQKVDTSALMDFARPQKKSVAAGPHINVTYKGIGLGGIALTVSPKIKFKNRSKRLAVGAAWLLVRIVRHIKKVLSTATYTRQSNLANHLKSAHSKDSRNARGCMIPLRKFATCGICDDDVLFTDCKTEEAHLWDTHWQKGHSMDMWITDHEIWKLICLRPGVYEAWQNFVHQDHPSSKQEHVSWKHLSTTDMKLLRFGLEGDFLDDHQIAKMAFEKAKLFLNVSASQVCHGPANSIGASRHVYPAGSNKNDRETSNGQVAADGP